MRKRIFLSITMLVISASSANAQSVWGGRVSLSHYIEKATYSNEQIYNHKGIELGPVLYYPLKDNLYLNTGAMLGIMIPEHGDHIINFYVDIPVYLGVQIPTKKSNLSYCGQAGPYLGFWRSTSDMINNFINPVQAGLGIIAGMNVKRFKLELGYKTGLTNLVSVNEGQVINGDLYMESKSKLSSLFFGISYVF